MSHATAVANNDEASRMITGENGHAALSAAGLGDTLLALFDKLVRGLPEDSVRANVAEVMKDARERAEPEMVKNLFVMTFHTRWCRGGKGERTLFYTLLKVLYALYPTVVLDLADLIPKYGYWKDLLSLLIECPIKCSAGQDVDYSAMHAKVWSLFARQIQTDLAELQCAQAQHRTPQLSLCAKFAPSEGGKHSKALQADKVYTPPSPPLPLSLSSIHTHTTHTKEICSLISGCSHRPRWKHRETGKTRLSPGAEGQPWARTIPPSITAPAVVLGRHLPDWALQRRRHALDGQERWWVCCQGGQPAGRRKRGVDEGAGGSG